MLPWKRCHRQSPTAHTDCAAGRRSSRSVDGSSRHRVITIGGCSAGLIWGEFHDLASTLPGSPLLHEFDLDSPGAQHGGCDGGRPTSSRDRCGVGMGSDRQSGDLAGGIGNDGVGHVHVHCFRFFRPARRGAAGQHAAHTTHYRHRLQGPGHEVLVDGIHLHVHFFPGGAGPDRHQCSLPHGAPGRV